MNTSTDWISALAILVAGLLIGAMVFYLFSKRRSVSLDGDLERKDLEAKRDALIAELRALPEDAAEERARLERETANVLRTLDRHAPAPAARVVETQTSAVPAMNPTIKGFLWGAGSFAVLAALGYFVMQSLEPRTDAQQAPMQQAAPQPQQPDPALMQLQAAVQRDPNNLALRNDLAAAYFEREDLMNVFEQSKFVLEKDPNNSRALTFGALVRVAMGETDTAMSMLTQATKSDPKNLDGWVALAWLNTQSNRMSEAEAAIAEAKKVAPQEQARLDEVFRQMKAQAAQAASQPQTASTLPPDHPPIDGAAPTMSAPAGRNVRVTLQLDPSASTKSGIVFVIARNPAGGPPAAAKRVVVQSFPVTVDLGAADSMMGQPLPDVFRLEARLDSDGDAATRPPTDPKASQENVAPGATVTLSLK
jgi:tetratricopeptide (TPR) repeat protein